MAEFDLSNLQGLLSQFQPNEEDQRKAQQMGLLSAGLGILAQNAQNPRGAGFGGALSGALPGVQAYQQTLESGPKQRMAQLQNALAMKKFAKEMELEKARAGIFGTPGVSPTAALSLEATGGGLLGPTQAAADRIQPPNPFGMNPAGVQKYLGLGGDPKLIETLRNMGPRGTLGKLDPKDYTPDSFTRYMQNDDPSVLRPRTKMEVHAPTGEAFDPFSLVPGQRLGVDPNKPFSVGPDGKIIPNAPFQNYELTKAATGAPKTQVNVPVNTEKTFFGNVAEGMGKEVVQGTSQARAALGTLNTIGQITDALDSGKVIAGPGTTARVFLGQLGQVLGTSGRDATETLTNTRATIQGLAQLELDAAQQMKGQGQITEAERGIIRRAASGDIDGMTAIELRTLTSALDKTARFKIRQNAANVEKLRKNPASASILPFIEVQEPPPRGGVNALIDRYAPKR